MSGVASRRRSTSRFAVGILAVNAESGLLGVKDPSDRASTLVRSARLGAIVHKRLDEVSESSPNVEAGRTVGGLI